MKPKYPRQIRTAPAKTAQHLAALHYAAEGFAVLPIWPNAKNPLTPNGFKDATTNHQQINEWWTRWPTANVAIHTKDLLVLDIDVKNGIDGYDSFDELEAEYGELPTTRTQETPSGGLHMIFRTTGVTIPSVTNCPRPGIDVRAVGGYILAEPSIVGGNVYEMNEDEIADAPEWLVELLLNLEAGQEGYHEDDYSAEDRNTSRICINLKPTSDPVRIKSMGKSITVSFDHKEMSFVVQ